MTMPVYIITIVAIIWAINAFKSFLVQKTIDSLDKKNTLLKENEQVFQKKIDQNISKLETIKHLEESKTKEEALDFWNKQDIN